jgi:GNAT superfamily N-acetyltransferase
MSRAGSTLECPIGTLSIVRATVEDAGRVQALRDDSARWLQERGVEQWQPGELPLDWIEIAIATGSVFLVSRGDHLVGSVTIMGNDPLVWGEQAEPAGYMHLLMVDRAYNGHGIGRALLAWTETFILETGRGLARMDCARSNAKLRAYYERAGYRFVADKTFPDIEWARPTCLYEKTLTT